MCKEYLEKMSVLLAGEVLIFVRGQSQAQVNLSTILLLPRVWFLQVPPATHSAGWQVLDWYLHTPQQLVTDLAGRGVESLLDELPQSPAILHLVELVQLLIHALLGVEVPDIQPHAVLLHTVHISEIKFNNNPCFQKQIINVIGY